MPFQRSRRALLAACLSGAVLAACGGGDVVSQFTPQRIVVFGDSLADLGQAGSRFTINDGTTNIWTQQVAARYGLPLAASASGGTSFATGNARVAAAADAAGNAATPTVGSQLAGYTPAAGDLVLVAAGTADVIAEARQAQLGSQTREQGLANLDQAARQLGQQVRDLVQRGASHVVVVGPYDLAISPWARSTNSTALLQEYSRRFIAALKVSMVDLGGRVLYVDLEDYINRIYNSPQSYGLTDGRTVACASVDPGPGIGIGENQVNSALCTPGTLQPGVEPNRWLFADPVYLTPAAHRLFGDFAYDSVRRNW